MSYTCFECGRQIEENQVSCTFCGCPTEYIKMVEEAYAKDQISLLINEQIDPSYFLQKEENSFVYQRRFTFGSETFKIDEHLPAELGNENGFDVFEKAIITDDDALLEQAVSIGCSRAKIHYAFILLDGNEELIDVPRAAKLFKSAIFEDHVTDNAEAAFALGTLYENGDGIEKDPSKAQELYEMAAKHGHEQAAIFWAENKLHGWGVDQDFFAAMDMFWQLRHNSQALFNLGIGYEAMAKQDSYSQRQYLQIAKKCLEKASALGSSNATDYLQEFNKKW